MGAPEAIVISSLIGAGSSAIQASKNRKVAAAQERAANQRAAAQRKAALQEQKNQRFRERVQNQVAKNQLQDVQNVGLREKGIAPVGRDLSAAILNDASQAG